MLNLLNLFISTVLASCPNIASKDLPLCPPGQVISENYPVKAIAVANFPNRRRFGNDAMADLVEKILVNSGENPPAIIMSTTPREKEEVYARLNTMNVDPKLKEKWRQAIREGNSMNMHWQQDFFEAFIDPTSGNPVLREVDGYHPGHYSNPIEVFEGFYRSIDPSCEIQRGAKLTGRGFHGGMSGGNIEALPGGICVLGDSKFASDVDWKQYADQFCSADPNRRIKAPTKWLEVGHSDEIFKVVRNNKVKAPCDFSIALSSPRMAFQLMNEKSQERFMSPNFSDADLNEWRANSRYNKTQWSGYTLKQICEEAQKIYTNPPSSKPGGASALSQLLYFMVLPANVYATNQFDCKNLTNGQVLNLINQNSLRRYNDRVQEKIDAFRNEMVTKLKIALPSCKIDFIEVPDIFAGADKEGKLVDDPRNGFGKALLPNLSSSVSLNDVIISSDPSNKTFRDYVRTEYEKRGLRVDFIDTNDSLHEAGGNLHCATHTIHTCRPRPK
jgi:hypothetical protein